MALGRHGLRWVRDEPDARRNQVVAGVGWEYEARDEVSSCHPARHDWPRPEACPADPVRDELDTDLQWGLTDTAGADAAAGHRHLHDRPGVAAGRRRRTWAEVDRRHARRYGRAQKPAFGRRRA